MKRYKVFNFRKLCPEITSTTYLTHGIHSYTAKFIPQMPSYFIKKYCDEKDTVLDPFCGSGTTLLEANVNNVNAIGIDINPLARLIAKVKTTSIDPVVLSKANDILKKKLKERVKLNYNVDFPNKNYWFHKKAVFQIRKIFTVVNGLYEKELINQNLKDYYYVCISSIIRKSSYADPDNPKTYCSPRMRAKKDANEPTFPIKYFLETIKSNYDKMKEAYVLLDNKNVTTSFFDSNDAREIEGMNKVNLIITSPPYANAQEYFRNIKLELYWLGLADRDLINNLDKKQIGGENHAAFNFSTLHLTGINSIDRLLRKIFLLDKKRAYIVYKYFYDMEKTLFECSRILRGGGHLVIIVGNNSVKGYRIPIHKGLIELSKKHNFRIHELGYDRIKCRNFMVKRNNNADPIDKDWVIDLVKE